MTMNLVAFNLKSIDLSVFLICTVSVFLFLICTINLDKLTLIKFYRARLIIAAMSNLLFLLHAIFHQDMK